jgi:hypothetical protein
MTPQEMIARNIGDNIILSIDKMISPDAADLKAAAAMNIAAVLSRHAGLTEEQTTELLRRCIAADKKAGTERQTMKPRKKGGQGLAADACRESMRRAPATMLGCREI